MLHHARLIKLKSDNGLFTMQEGVPLGKVYWVDLNTIRMAMLFNVPTQRQHHARIINCEDGTYLPLELLSITEETKPEATDS